MGHKDRNCHKCGQEGHLSGKCPNTSKIKKMKCFLCGKGGHLRKDCPYNDINSNIIDNQSHDPVDPVRPKSKQRERGQKKPTKKKKDHQSLLRVSYPVTSHHIIDMNYEGDINDFQGSDEFVSNEKFGNDFPYELLDGVLIRCPLDVHHYTFKLTDSIQSMDKSIGYSVGIPPIHTSAWINHHKLLTGIHDDDLRPLRDVIVDYYARSSVVGMGPMGLNYTSHVLANSSRESQLTCLRLQLEAAMMCNEACTRRSILSKEPDVEMTALIPDDEVETVPCLCVHDCGPAKFIYLSAEKSENDVETPPLTIDSDILGLLRNLTTSSACVGDLWCPLVVQLSPCGLEWDTVVSIMDMFPQCYFSIDCRITHAKQKYLREYVFDIPLCKIVLESNSPYFPPMLSTGDSCNPLKATFSHPGHILIIAQAISEIKCIDLDTVVEACYRNAMNVIYQTREK